MIAEATIIEALEAKIARLQAEEKRLRPDSRLQCAYNKAFKSGATFSPEVHAQFRAWRRMGQLIDELRSEIWDLRRREAAAWNLDIARRYLAGDVSVLAWLDSDNRFLTLEDARAHWCQQAIEEAQSVGVA